MGVRQQARFTKNLLNNERGAGEGRWQKGCCPRNDDIKQTRQASSKVQNSGVAIAWKMPDASEYVVKIYSYSLTHTGKGNYVPT